MEETKKIAAEMLKRFDYVELLSDENTVAIGSLTIKELKIITMGLKMILGGN